MSLCEAPKIGKSRNPFVIPPVTQPSGLSILAGQQTLCKLLAKCPLKVMNEVVSRRIPVKKAMDSARAFYVLSLVFPWFIGIFSPALAAPNNKITAKRPFQLKVRLDELPQLSRDELGLPSQGAFNVRDSNREPLIGEIALPGEIDELSRSPQIGFVPPSTGLPEQGAPQQSNEEGLAFKQKELMPRNDADDGNGSLREYGVDWSAWVSKLADRWYFALTKMERQSGLQFHTVRPALIHFTCYANGQIGEMYVKQSSGVPLYDEMQMQALLTIVPVHAFPRGTQRTSYSLVQGWESHPRQAGEEDFRPGSFGRGTPMEIVKQWMSWR